MKKYLVSCVIKDFSSDYIAKVLTITKLRNSFLIDCIYNHLYYFYSPKQTKELKEWYIITHLTTQAAI